MQKVRLGLIFGGESTEHEVSLLSARSIINEIDKEKYEITLIGIDKQGKWQLYNDTFLENENNPNLIKLNKTNYRIVLQPGEEKYQISSKNANNQLNQLDVVFPILHGTSGEDGSIQGMLKLLNVPYVGSSLLGSAISMDKDIAKILLKSSGLEVAKSLTFKRDSESSINFEKVKNEISLPMFIKPANQGSSVGVSKVIDSKSFYEGIKLAFKYDHKILIEEAIDGRELECAILGNDQPIASKVGEIRTINNFYSYNSKYIDENGAELLIPAPISNHLEKKVQKVALKAFKVLECEGFARVDVFLTKDERVIVNEVNTIPGFTKISMYPKLFMESGISYKQLIDKLIDLAIEKHHYNQKLKNKL